MSCGDSGRRPEWLKVRLRTDESFRRLRSMVSELRLNTVCAEARCPNIYECWNAGTATFMILGETCTRRCGFCSVNSGRPEPGVDADEPRHVAEAVERLGFVRVFDQGLNEWMPGREKDCLVHALRRVSVKGHQSRSSFWNPGEKTIQDGRWPDAEALP